MLQCVWGGGVILQMIRWGVASEKLGNTGIDRHCYTLVFSIRIIRNETKLDRRMN